MVEYGLIIGLVAIVAIATLSSTGSSVSSLLTSISTATEAAATCVVQGEGMSAVCAGTCSAGKNCVGTPVGNTGCDCAS